MWPQIAAAGAQALGGVMGGPDLPMSVSSGVENSGPVSMQGQTIGGGGLNMSDPSTALVVGSSVLILGAVLLRAVSK